MKDILDRLVAIIAYQRSGTHFLGSCLDSHPDMQYLGEVFVGAAHRKESGEINYQLRFDHPVDNVSLEKGLRFIQKTCFANSNLEIAVLDVKYNYITEPIRKLLEKIKVIHLIRRDLKRRYISMLLWEEYKRNPVRYVFGMTPDISIDKVDMKLDIQNVLGLQQQFSYLENLRLYYEDLTNNKQTNRLLMLIEERLCKFLGVSLHPLATCSLKIAPENINQFVHWIKP